MGFPALSACSDLMTYQPGSLSVSIVSYDPNVPELRATLESLIAAIAVGRGNGHLGSAQLFLVDNGPLPQCKMTLQELLHDLQDKDEFDSVSLLSGHGNIGFGAGHNLALEHSKADFFLILNPDVILDRNAISEAVDFMRGCPEAGLVTPSSTGSGGHVQFLCKRYPTILDLMVRGFAPASIKRIFHKRLNRYEIHDLYTGNAPVLDIPIASGCFMFLRRHAWEDIGGFSKNYFMYFEDFDLCLRLAKTARLAYVPSVRIQHYGGDAAKKGWRHILMFARSAWTFFHTHGWRLW